MFMNVSAQKKLAAKVMKVGISRVRILDDKEVSEAITRNDIKRLVARGVITKVEKRGVSKKYSAYRLSQKKRGRRMGKGTRKGSKYAKKSSKRHWIDKVRALRKMLTEMRDEGTIERSDYRKLYYQVKGGAFRNKKHMLYYLKSKEILKEKKGVKHERNK
jgi:large subunit ribosomal protein L19e